MIPPTTADDPMGPESRSDGRPSRLGGLAWLLLGLLAMLVFELTANPALAVTVGCLKLGGDGLAAAVRRWRADPNRPRARATALFLAAWSLWRVTGIAVLVFVLLVFGTLPFRDALRARGVGLKTEIVTALVLTGIGTVLAALMSYLAIAWAWRAGVAVWVGRPTGDNRVKWTIEAVVALTACLLPFAGTLGTLGLAHALGGLGLDQGWTAMLGLGLSCLVMSGLPAFSRAAVRRVVATSPESDWPPAGPEAIFNH